MLPASSRGAGYAKLYIKYADMRLVDLSQQQGRRSPIFDMTSLQARHPFQNASMPFLSRHIHNKLVTLRASRSSKLRSLASSALSCFVHDGSEALL
jgi:hypothetical protein